MMVGFEIRPNGSATLTIYILLQDPKIHETIDLFAEPILVFDHIQCLVLSLTIATLVAQ